MNYTVLILRRAQRELARLPNEEYERVRDAIRSLVVIPRPWGLPKTDGARRLAHSCGHLSSDL